MNGQKKKCRKAVEPPQGNVCTPVKYIAVKRILLDYFWKVTFREEFLKIKIGLLEHVTLKII